jgi:DNA-binding PadR family transcriptional regulator
MKDIGVLVMVALSDGPKHGYAIQSDIESFAGLHLGPGTLYGAIGRLEREGSIVATAADDRRRPYALTADGRSKLAESLALLRRVTRRAVMT